MAVTHAAALELNWLQEQNLALREVQLQENNKKVHTHHGTHANTGARNSTKTKRGSPKATTGMPVWGQVEWTVYKN